MTRRATARRRPGIEEAPRIHVVHLDTPARTSGGFKALLESLLAGILGLGVLVVVLGHGPAGGAFFAAGLAAYTLGRQGILHLRAEQRKTRLGALVTAFLAALCSSQPSYCSLGNRRVRRLRSYHDP